MMRLSEKVSLFLLPTNVDEYRRGLRAFLLFGQRDQASGFFINCLRLQPEVPVCAIGLSQNKKNSSSSRL